MASMQTTTAVISPGPTCKNCHKRPVYVENGRIHDFCGRRCMSQSHQQNSAAATPAAQTITVIPPAPALTPIVTAQSTDSAAAALMAPQTPVQTPASTSPTATAVFTVGGSPSGNPICALSGCKRPAYPGSPYCGQRHRQEAITRGEAEVCLFCRKLPKNMINNKLSDFCSRRCGQDTISHTPIILRLDAKSAIYEDIVNQFTTKWKHTATPPTVYKAWKIYSKKEITDRFWQYKNAVERRSAIPGGNCKRRWHGTARMCKLGDDDEQHEFCKARGCSLCRIIESSFQLTRMGQNTSYGRFGTGIYTSATSSKAHSYVREQGGSPYKAMLLNDVVMGKTMKLTQSNPNLTAPPAGYDSVVGEPGGDLNYDEAIVYQNEAIRPLFLIIYS